MRKKYIVKKGFVSYYTMVILFVFSIIISLAQFQVNSKLLLKKIQKNHLIKIKAYQLVKEYELEEFEIDFLGEKIKSEVEDNQINLSFLDKELEVTYNKKSGVIEDIKVK